MRHFGIFLFILTLLLSRTAPMACLGGNGLKYSPHSKTLSVSIDCEENISEEEDDYLPLDFLPPVFFLQARLGVSSLGLPKGADCNIAVSRPPLYCLHRVYLI